MSFSRLHIIKPSHVYHNVDIQSVRDTHCARVQKESIIPLRSPLTGLPAWPRVDLYLIGPIRGSKSLGWAPHLSLIMTDHNLTLVVPRLSGFPQLEVSSVLVSHPNPGQLPQNHVLVRVDRFGFTANNVSYQVLGEVPHFR